MKKLSVLLAACCAASALNAQVNDRGTFQIGLGTSLGIFKTEFENSFTLPGGVQVSNSEEDEAATFSVPIDLQVGVAERISLGLCLEPGRYIDSAGTHPNSFFIFSIQPRFYVLNYDQFALHINADLGVSALRITSNDGTADEIEDTYGGGHFRFGAQAQYFFGDMFGINIGVKFASHTLEWKDRDPENATLSSLKYEAQLKTGGVIIQGGVQLKL